MTNVRVYYLLHDTKSPLVDGVAVNARFLTSILTYLNNCEGDLDGDRHINRSIMLIDSKMIDSIFYWVYS